MNTGTADAGQPLVNLRTRSLLLQQLPLLLVQCSDPLAQQRISAHYARPFRDAEEREKVRKSLAAIGFGNAQVDQPVDQRPI